MPFIHLGQKRHTVSSLSTRYSKSNKKETIDRIRKDAELYLSPQDFILFCAKIKK